jgi:hypothetical protein
VRKWIQPEHALSGSQSACAWIQQFALIELPSSIKALVATEGKQDAGGEKAILVVLRRLPN